MSMLMASPMNESDREGSKGEVKSSLGAENGRGMQRTILKGVIDKVDGPVQVRSFIVASQASTRLKSRDIVTSSQNPCSSLVFSTFEGARTLPFPPTGYCWLNISNNRKQ